MVLVTFVNKPIPVIKWHQLNIFATFDTLSLFFLPLGRKLFIFDACSVEPSGSGGEGDAGSDLDVASFYAQNILTEQLLLVKRRNVHVGL